MQKSILAQLKREPPMNPLVDKDYEMSGELEAEGTDPNVISNNN